MENYRCFGRIGEGAHGVVYQAQEIKTGQKVALKKIPLKRLEDGLPIQGKHKLNTKSESQQPIRRSFE